VVSLQSGEGLDYQNGDVKGVRLLLSPQRLREASMIERGAIVSAAILLMGYQPHAFAEEAVAAVRRISPVSLSQVQEAKNDGHHPIFPSRTPAPPGERSSVSALNATPTTLLPTQRPQNPAQTVNTQLGSIPQGQGFSPQPSQQSISQPHVSVASTLTVQRNPCSDKLARSTEALAYDRLMRQSFLKDSWKGIHEDLSRKEKSMEDGSASSEVVRLAAIVRDQRRGENEQMQASNGYAKLLLDLANCVVARIDPTRPNVAHSTQVGQGNGTGSSLGIGQSRSSTEKIPASPTQAPALSVTSNWKLLPLAQGCLVSVPRGSSVEYNDRTTWSGPCELGRPVNGEGAFTYSGENIRTVHEGKMSSGAFDGPVQLSVYMARTGELTHREDLIYRGGCELGSKSACQPMTTEVASQTGSSASTGTSKDRGPDASTAVLLNAAVRSCVTISRFEKRPYALGMVLLNGCDTAVTVTFCNRQGNFPCKIVGNNLNGSYQTTLARGAEKWTNSAVNQNGSNDIAFYTCPAPTSARLAGGTWVCR
jgi:hypothetical protein